MADLIVTFGRGLSAPPVMDGNPRRTEVVTIGGSAEETTLTATQTENIVDLYAGADCWVEIGAAPEAAVPNTDGETSSGFIATGERMQFKISTGEKVSVIAA